MDKLFLSWRPSEDIFFRQLTNLCKMSVNNPGDMIIQGRLGNQSGKMVEVFSTRLHTVAAEMFLIVKEPA